MPLYTVNDVKPDGSCFYRSVYNVLKCYSYLIPFCNYVFKRHYDNEDVFVVELRKYISSIITQKKDGNHIHNIFTTLREVDSMTYKEILNGMPSWFVRLHPNRPRDEDVFRENVATSVRRINAWASQVDIPIFMTIFNKCFKRHVTLTILNDIPAKMLMRKNTLFVLNLGEAHYNYIIYKRVHECDHMKFRNPSTSRCINVNGNVGRKVLETTTNNSST